MLNVDYFGSKEILKLDTKNVDFRFEKRLKYKPALRTVRPSDISFYLTNLKFHSFKEWTNASDINFLKIFIA